MTRPSVRRALADARELAGLEPSSPSAVATAAAVAYAAKHGAHALPATVTPTLVDVAVGDDDEDGKNKGKADAYFVTPVAVAVDRTGGHAAMREDILLPLNVTDDAVSRLAHKLCQETGMAPSSAGEIKEQVLEYLAPFRVEEKEEGEGDEASALPSSSSAPPLQRFAIPRPRSSSRPSSASRVVEIRIDAHCDGVRVEDHLLWDLADPAPMTAAWAAETARDLRLGAQGCAALRSELESAIAAAREREDIGSGGGGDGETVKRDRGAPASDVSSWLPQVAEDRGGWGDA